MKHTLGVFIALLAMLLAMPMSAQKGSGWPQELAVSDFRKALDEGKAKLVDVRTPAEFASGHLEGSLNIDWTAADYEKRFAALDPKVPVLLYCHSGGRSEQALEYLLSKGFKASHLEGGITAWKRAGLPVVKQ
jgi:rhodanese-related sulfurtransferase